MNNLDKDGLKRIYLIRSADYQYTNIDLTDTTLLLGASGVGKTTLMRAILFFYTMDDSMLNIDLDSKRPFNQWYFKDNNSHIIYEYTKDDNKYLFIVSSSGKLHYTFVDITNSNIGVKELFLKEKIPANLQVLNENIQKNSLPNFDTFKKDEYINTFHLKDVDGKKIKQNSKTSFVLFSDITSRKEFAKTLSNIFKTSKVTSSDIKETIVSLIDDSTANINLLDIRRDFDNFISEKNEIERFEKKIPKIEKLSDTLAQYSISKKEFKDKANQIKAIKDKSLLTIESKKTKITELETTKEEIKINFLADDKIIKKSIENQKRIVNKNTDEIDKLTKKDKEYKDKNIEKLVVEHNKKSSYENSLKMNKDKLDALTSDQDEINNKYKIIFKNLEKDRDSTILNIQKAKIKKDEKITSQKEKLIDNRDENIEKSTLELSNKKEDLESQLITKNDEFKKTEIAQGKLENFPFNKENINRYTNEIKKYEDELSTIEPKIIYNQNKITNIEKEILDIPIQLNIDKDKLSKEIENEKNILFEKKENIEKKLDFENDNLYGVINKSNLVHKEKIVTYIKDDILFSNKEFSIKEIDSTDTIFGMELNFKDKLSNNYDQTKLLEQLKIVKSDIQKCNKKFIDKSAVLVDEANNKSKIRNKIKDDLFLEKDTLSKNKEKYKERKLESIDNLKEANKIAKKLNKDETQRLNQQYLEQESLIKILNDQVKDLKLKINKIEKSIKEDTKQIISDLKQKSKALIKKEEADITEVNSDYQTNFDKTRQELSDALSDKGIDTKLLQEYQSKIDEFTKKLKDIKNNYSYVVVYQEEYKEKISNIPNLNKSLIEDNQILASYTKEQEELENDYKKVDLEIIENIKIQNDIKESLDKFIQNYEERILNQPIQKDINNVISLEYNENIDELLSKTDFMNDIISSIIESYIKVNKDEGGIEKYLGQCLNGLSKNNIFKIEIINDFIDNNILEYIRIAKDLVEYVEKNKIKVFKDNSSDMFKSSINSIIKALDMFNNAVSDIYTEVNTLKNTVKKAVSSFQVIDNIYIKAEDSNNEVLQMLKSITEFYNENSDKLLDGLFGDEKVQEELSSRIVDLVSLLIDTKEKIDLKDGFLLKFKVIEKGNDLHWRETLNDIGSNGTSTLVKSIINIAMLQMVSKGMNNNEKIVSHCILDEIGTISTDYFRELKNFVNKSGFHFVNGMPVEDDMLISMYPTVYVGEDCGSYSKMVLVSKEVI